MAAGGARRSFNQDFCAGVLFAAFGAGGLWFGRNYQLGSAIRMGPGYFPTVLSWLLIGLGALVAGRGVLRGGLDFAAWRLRPLAAVLLAFVAFALCIERVGFPLAAMATVLVAATGGGEFRWREQIALGAVLALVLSGVFIWGIGLPMALWPR